MLHSKKRFPPSMFEMDGNARRHKARVKKRERKRGPEREGERKGEGEKRKRIATASRADRKTYRYPMERRYPPRTSWKLE